MADSFTLAGSYVTKPLVGSPSGIAGINAPVDESLVLTKKDYDTITLDTDAATPVPLVSGMTAIHVLVLKATGGKVRARITSADGATQAIPVDDFATIISRSVPITAVDLTRVAGVLTTVDVFMGQTT